MVGGEGTAGAVARAVAAASVEEAEAYVPGGPYDRSGGRGWGRRRDAGFGGGHVVGTVVVSAVVAMRVGMVVALAGLFWHLCHHWGAGGWLRGGALRGSSSNGVPTGWMSTVGSTAGLVDIARKTSGLNPCLSQCPTPAQSSRSPTWGRGRPAHH